MEIRRLKIVVFGSFHAGKSTLIHCLDPSCRHIDVPSEHGPTTIAFDFGRVSIGDVSVHLYGTPGQERFEFCRQILARGMDAAIIVIDSTTDIDDMTLELHRWLRSAGVPLAVMLNKCDAADSCADRFRDYLGNELMYPVSALSGSNVKPALTSFVGQISADQQSKQLPAAAEHGEA
ncbi:MAG: GTP-binding protein [Methanobacteriota archaeon]|nr:MAG: GTP-binding protein [Euryarchaeota archaeon]